jgi:hypothetical protein
VAEGEDSDGPEVELGQGGAVEGPRARRLVPGVVEPLRRAETVGGTTA